uniref:Uncharacterized protein n=1 Tax=Glycine max TaxID=3847 RepID=C6TD91_SOYBN|nr:unknown [Glycine max]
MKLQKQKSVQKKNTKNLCSSGEPPPTAITRTISVTLHLLVSQSPLPILLFPLPFQPLFPQFLHSLPLLLTLIFSPIHVTTFILIIITDTFTIRLPKIPRQLNPLPRKPIAQPILLILRAHRNCGLGLGSSSLLNLLPPLRPIPFSSTVLLNWVKNVDPLEEVDVARVGGRHGFGAGGRLRFGFGRRRNRRRQASSDAESVEAELGVALPGLFTLELLLPGGLLFVATDLLSVVEIVNVPSLLGENVETSVPSHSRLLATYYHYRGLGISRTMKIIVQCCTHLTSSKD